MILNKTIQTACCILLALSFLASCAKVGNLQGGLKDTAPPQLDSLKSTPNFATRFTGRSIELGFNEWVQLSDVAKQVVISPPLAKRPEITLKGKIVRLTLDESEVLRPNTTYTINFGNAVKDFTEGNPAKDLRFVFSTGDALDSLKVTGAVADALTGEPAENIAVMLYENLTDSVLRKERPYYFALTDKSGQYQIQNVKKGTFKLLAFEDTNGNLLWESNEKIAFSDKDIMVSDTQRAQPLLLVCTQQAAYKLSTKETNQYGLAKLIYTGIPKTKAIETTQTGLKWISEQGGDTLYVWYDFPEAAPENSWNFNIGGDSVKVRALSRPDFIKNNKLTFAREAPPSAAASSKTRGGQPNPATSPTNLPPRSQVKTTNQNPTKPCTLEFNFPIMGIDTSKWVLTDSSRQRVQAFVAEKDSLIYRKIQLNHAWKQGQAYKLTLLPGAVTDYWGTANSDTLRRNINVISEKQLGGINITLLNLKPGTHYVFQLQEGTNTIWEQQFLSEGKEKKIKLANIPATTYSIKVIEDLVPNGRWDASDYFAKRQPERIFSKKLEPLRPNWDLDVAFEIGLESAKSRK